MSKMKNAGTPGLVFSILGVLTFWIPFLGTLLSLLAIVASKAALSRIKRHPKQYSGTVIAMIGFLLGLLFFIISLIWLGLVVFLFGSGYLVGKLF